MVGRFLSLLGAARRVLALCKKRGPVLAVALRFRETYEREMFQKSTAMHPASDSEAAWTALAV